MALTTILREVVLDDGHLLSVNACRIGSYVTGGQTFGVSSQFTKIYGAALTPMGTISHFLNVKAIPGATPGSFLIYARKASGSNVTTVIAQTGANVVIGGSHQAWLLGQTR